jgi:hypothetical protein
MALLIISRLSELPAALRAMEREAVSQGFNMITRLQTEWESGINRFAREGELLLGTFRGERLLGIGGLSRDPYIRRSARRPRAAPVRNER